MWQFLFFYDQFHDQFHTEKGTEENRTARQTQLFLTESSVAMPRQPQYNGDNGENDIRRLCMHKVSQALIALAAAGICAFMTWLTYGAGLFTMIYNVAFLVLMLGIILFAWLFGFRRMRQSIQGLDRASGKLINVYQNKMEMAEITKAGAQIFEVSYLDRKYQEYLAYLRKTNSPADIGDYIGEYELNNYTHRRLIEMVPDVLTSLGILGTFIGLVIGLRGFNPVSYEAMASSITSLIDGIKVAFVTSIYGLTLSLAFTYVERGCLTQVSESLDNFLDKYYLCAVTPTDATAMNHVLSNQKNQIRAIEGMGQTISQELAVNQQAVLEKTASWLTETMHRELYSEFAEMRNILRETSRVQKEYAGFLTEATSTLESGVTMAHQETVRTLQKTEKTQSETVSQLQQQQEHLTEFVEYVSKAMESMANISVRYDQALKEMTTQIEAMAQLAESSAQSAARAEAAAKDAGVPRVVNHVDDIEELTERLDQMIDLLERQQRMLLAGQKSAKKGFFRGL